MCYRVLASMSAVAVVAAVASLSTIPVAAQAPRTAWGQPDLRGIWDFRTITPLQRARGVGR